MCREPSRSGEYAMLKIAMALEAALLQDRPHHLDCRAGIGGPMVRGVSGRRPRRRRRSASVVETTKERSGSRCAVNGVGTQLSSASGFDRRENRRSRFNRPLIDELPDAICRNVVEMALLAAAVAQPDHGDERRLLLNFPFELADRCLHWQSCKRAAGSPLRLIEVRGECGDKGVAR